MLHADIITDRVDGRSKGCGVVEFVDAESAKKAIDMFHETDFAGRHVFLREDRELERPAFVARPAPTGPVRTAQLYVGNVRSSPWGPFNLW